MLPPAVTGLLLPATGAAGIGSTVKTLLLVAVPEGVITRMVPVVPLPTVAVICVAEFTVKEVAAVPPMLTAVAPVNFVPVMVTVAVPAQPEAGVKEVIVGRVIAPILQVVISPVRAVSIAGQLPPVLQTLTAIKNPKLLSSKGAGLGSKVTFAFTYTFKLY
jgi:hypothetical protein